MSKMRTLVLAPAVALDVLAGCATERGAATGGPGMGGPGMGGPGMGGPGMGGPGMGGGPGSGPMMGGGGGPGQGMGGGMGMGGDMAQTCAMYRELTAGKSPAEQRAAVEQRMQSMHGGSMTPEQVRMRREMMERNCAAAPASR